MVKTFIIDWPVLLLIGLVFGYGVNGTPDRSLLLTRAYLSGKIVMVCFVAIVYYSYLVAPDWMWMYFVKGADVPWWVVIYVLILYFFAYDAGFFLKGELSRMNRYLPPLFMVVLLVWEVGVTLGLKERYVKVGTLEEFVAGTAMPLAESAVGQVPVILTVILIPLAIGLLVWSRRQRF